VGLFCLDFEREESYRDTRDTGGAAGAGTSPSLLFQPWVDQIDAEIGKTPGITRDDGEMLLQGRSCDHAIRHTQGPSDGLPLVSLCKLSGVKLCTLFGVFFKNGRTGGAYGRVPKARP